MNCNKERLGPGHLLGQHFLCSKLTAVIKSISRDFLDDTLQFINQCFSNSG